MIDPQMEARLSPSLFRSLQEAADYAKHDYLSCILREETPESCKTRLLLTLDEQTDKGTLCDSA